MEVALVIIGLAAGSSCWLGLEDGRVGVSGRHAGARATGILLFAAIALSTFAGWYGFLAVALSAVYLLGWFRGHRLARATRPLRVE